MRRQVLCHLRRCTATCESGITAGRSSVCTGRGVISWRQRCPTCALGSKGRIRESCVCKRDGGWGGLYRRVRAHRGSNKHWSSSSSSGVQLISMQQWTCPTGASTRRRSSVAGPINVPPKPRIGMKYLPWMGQCTHAVTVAAVMSRAKRRRREPVARWGRGADIAADRPRAGMRLDTCETIGPAQRWR